MASITAPASPSIRDTGDSLVNDNNRGTIMILRNVLIPASLGLAISLLTACGGSGGGGKSNSSSLAPSSSSPPTSSSSVGVSSTPSSSLAASSSSATTFTGLLIEAEDYIRYYDTTVGNTTGEYRTDGVDIEKSTDAGGGFNIAYIVAR